MLGVLRSPEANHPLLVLFRASFGTIADDQKVRVFVVEVQGRDLHVEGQGAREGKQGLQGGLGLGVFAGFDARGPAELEEVFLGLTGGRKAVPFPG